jgi:hypothetical protein
MIVYFASLNIFFGHAETRIMELTFALRPLIEITGRGVYSEADCHRRFGLTNADSVEEVELMVMRRMQHFAEPHLPAAKCSGYSLDNAYVSISTVAKDLQSLLIRRTVVCSDSLLDTIKFDNHRTLANPGFVNGRRYRTCKDPATRCLKRGARELSILSQRGNIGDRSIRGNQIRFGHDILLFRLGTFKYLYAV